MLLKLIMGWFIITNVVEPMNEKNDDRAMFTIHVSDAHVIDHAYKEEVLNWIKTGDFVYEESLNSVKYPELFTKNIEK